MPLYELADEEVRTAILALSFVSKHPIEDDIEHIGRAKSLALTIKLSRIKEASPPEPLTHQQAEVLSLIVDYLDANGCSPCYQEVADNFGWTSLASVHEHVEHLEEKGYIRRAQKGAERNVAVIHRGWVKSQNAEPVV